MSVDSLDRAMAAMQAALEEVHVAFERKWGQPAEAALARKAQLLRDLKEIQKVHDAELAHSLADDALLLYIDDAEIRKAFYSIKRWYG